MGMLNMDLISNPEWHPDAVIQCGDPYDVDLFLRECEKLGYIWDTGEVPTGVYVYFHKYFFVSTTLGRISLATELDFRQALTGRGALGIQAMPYQDMWLYDFTLDIADEEIPESEDLNRFLLTFS